MSPFFSLPLLLLLLLLSFSPSSSSSLSPSSLSSLKSESLSMLHHAYDSYLVHAFPLDELNPITCQGRGRDRSDTLNININDVLGDFSLTLIDSLDTLAIVGNKTEFHRAVRLVIENVRFDLDSLVSVFEVTIRVLGSLLSAHLILTQPELIGDFTLPGYQNELLSLAEDLGSRLLPAFENTLTGLPYPRVKLNQGVPSNVINETCTAGAGTLLLEFGLLSRLSGDKRYEGVARRAMKGLWERRSQKDLIGNVINIQTGSWVQLESGIGAGIDSFFEYLLKASIIFDDDEYLEMFQSSYQAIQTYMKDSSTGIYRNVHMNTGSTYTTWIDSLSAYFPGLQVLYGDLQGAIFNHEVHFSIWRRYGMLPERYDIQRKSVNIALYPLRPELVESTYFLYQATKDPYYLEVGARILRDLQTFTKLPCGFATIHNVHLRTHEDRMESFFIAETLKYLYLLFDIDHPLNNKDTPFVFSTEGHLIFLPKHVRKPQQPKRKKPPPSSPSTPPSTSSLTCPARFLTPKSLSHLHPEFERIRQEIGYQPKTELHPEESNLCLPEEAPSPLVHQVRIDPSSTKSKAGFHLTGNQLYFPSLAGYNLELHEIGAEILRIVKIDEVVVKPGVQVNLLESAFLQDANQALGEFATVKILGAKAEEFTEEEEEEEENDGEFMARPSLNDAHSTIPPAGIQGKTFFLSGLACFPLTKQEAEAVKGKIVLVNRGDCLFDAKINHCKDAGAIGVIVLNFEEAAFEMVVGPEVRNTPPPRSSGGNKTPEEEPFVPLPAVLVAQSVAEKLKGLKPDALISVLPDYLGEKTATSRGELLLNFNGRPVDNARILRRFPLKIQALFSS